MLLTASGTYADMWTGYPADIARRVQDLYYFQPINYGPHGIPAVFPMGPSVNSGVDEGVRLVLEAEARPSHEVPDGYGLCGYSQGGWVVSDLLDEFRHGRLQHLRGKLMAGATFGNPRRELDNAGGRGIADDTLVDTPDFWVDEFDPGDIYANVPNNDVGEDMTAIYKLVRFEGISDIIDFRSIAGMGSQLVGMLGGEAAESNTITEQILEMLRSPLREFPAAVMAIIKGLIFASAKPATAAHVEYHIRERSPGITYFEHAATHMGECARRVFAA